MNFTTHGDSGCSSISTLICCRGRGGEILKGCGRSCARYCAAVRGIGWRWFTAVGPLIANDALPESNFLAMLFLQLLACQKNYRITGRQTGKKGVELAKNFSSQRGGLPLHFLLMTNPGLIMEMGFFNPRFPRTAIFHHQPAFSDTL